MTTSDGTSCASYSGCSVNPYANDFLQVAFQLNQAASITFGIRLSDAGTQVTSVFSDRPFGRGSHTIYWDGTDQSGNLIVPPPYDSFSVNFGGFTLPQNAVFVEAAPQISAVAASPNYLDPFTGTYLSAPGQSTKISYTLSKQAAIALQVFSVDTGTLLRTITQPNVSAGSSTIAWDGRADNGIFAAQGSYRLALKAVDAQGSQSIIRYVLVKVFY
jgi:flagellar hook assembly protein FlgD